MAPTTSPSLYNQVVLITNRYFGPAARRFVDRQIESHLDINPEMLSTQDLIKLTDWMGLTMALLVEDKNLISKFNASLKKLTK